MHAVDVAERRDAEAEQVGAFPQAIAIDELRLRRILDRGVGAADVIARRARARRTLPAPSAAWWPSRRPIRRTVRRPSAGRR